MYLDPGFGSMIIQAILAGIAAFGALSFAYRKRIKTWWARKRGKPIETLEETYELESTASTEADEPDGIVTSAAIEEDSNAAPEEFK
jgi:hypothetical protein